MPIKPILFSTPMVQAIHALIKRHTRRIINPKTPEAITLLIYLNAGLDIDKNKEELIRNHAPIKTGDILWVRETWMQVHKDVEFEGRFSEFVYRADTEENEKKFGHIKNPVGERFIDSWKWKPSIFMPKEAARIFLKVTNVRVERLQDITEEDAISEGILRCPKADNTGTAYYDYSGKQTPVSYNFDSPIASFKTLWQSINGRESWEANPWVWVYEFEQVEKPKDFGNE